MSDPLLDVTEAAQRLRLSASLLNKLRMRPGAGPVYAKLGRSVRYRESDLDAWVAAQRVAPAQPVQDVHAFAAGESRDSPEAEPAAAG